MAAAPLLLLVDGHSLAFRSYYAFNKNGTGLATRGGIPTSVTYGFLKALLETTSSLGPQGVVITFDTADPTFRHEADPAYKANREEAPEAFHTDVENLQLVLREALNLPVCTAPGFEADDLLGTVANRAAATGWRVRILSGDRDLFQLVDDARDIACLYMGGGPFARQQNGPTLMDRCNVIDKLGVAPETVVDLKALTGDSSDNIPGVKGVGAKTAIRLLNAHGTLDGIYAALPGIRGALHRKLDADRDSAYRSRMLATIRLDVPLSQEPRLALDRVDAAALAGHLEQLELRSLRRQLDDFASAFSAGPSPGAADGVAAADSADAPDRTAGEAAGGAALEDGRPLLRPRVIRTEQELVALVEQLEGLRNPACPVALDTETTALNPFRAALVGIGVCWGEALDALAYIPIGHDSGSQLPLETVLGRLAAWLASAEHPKCLQNAKYDRLILLRHGLSLGGVVIDTLLADYLLDPGGRHSLDEIAQRRFGFRPTSYSELVARNQTIAALDVATAAAYCAMDVHLTHRLAPLLRADLEAAGGGLGRVLTAIEQPLEPVLAEMEATGIRIDVNYLAALSEQLGGQLERLVEQAWEAAGCRFNLASPKQLGQLLFGDLGLDRSKSRRTKTGYSTDATVLEKLSGDHPVVPPILEHRTLSKLKSTYVDALPALVEAETGRVHTDFNQAVTATGRLSSSHPNLQNIPIRTEFSRQIRKAFLPRQGWELISADYSQIELRILTHLSGEPVLVEAYRRGDDVHALTARLLLEKEEITGAERRLGKTINFGVIYGMGAQRFARSTGVSTKEAQGFLTRYRERYPRVFGFLELQERLALSRGYVETVLGRRRLFRFEPQGLGRYLGHDPLGIDLGKARRQGMEAQQLRAAANAPIQGSSADIIKLAMVRLHRRLEGLPARLLLQVHDELVLEVDPAARREVQQLVVETMQDAVQLKVPLQVEASHGPNWMEAK